MVLTAVIDAPPEHPSCASPASRFLGEHIPRIGRAQLDIITTVYSTASPSRWPLFPTDGTPR
jgi:hypothetical protein